MRILALSDIHDCFEAFPVGSLPDAEVCLIAGDLTNYGERGSWRLSSDDLREMTDRWGGSVDLSGWQGNEVARAREWLRALSGRYPIFWIAGNHDFGLVNETFASLPRCVGIMDRTVEFRGYRIHGVNLSPCYDAPLLAEMWTAMTVDPQEEARAYDFEPVEIVLSHSPPWGHCDSTAPLIGGEGDRHVGSQRLLEYIHKYSPKLVLCGHIHEGRGVSKIKTSQGVTVVHNIACACRLIEIVDRDG